MKNIRGESNLARFGIDVTVMDKTGIVKNVNVTPNHHKIAKQFSLSDNFSIGGTIDATDLNYKVEGTGFQDTEKVVDEFSMGSHFFLSYEINGGDYMSVAFRPYIQMPWESFNITGCERTNYPNSTVPESELKENLFNFGIMFIFYNGQQ